MTQLATDPSVQSAHQREVKKIFNRGYSIVCFGNDWKGDPTSKHHIMRSIAGATNVLWVEASGMRRPKVTSGLDLKRIFSKLRRSFARAREVDTRGVHVMSPLTLPLPGNAFATRLNALLYMRAVRRALQMLRGRGDPLLWVYIPTVAPFLEKIPNRGLVYHCVDRWWAFEEYDTELMRSHHAALCAQADLVIASSAALLEDCLAHTPKAFLVPHGVEWEHFSVAALNPPPQPPDIAHLNGPILGFFGLVHEWVDTELIATIARSFPKTNVVLIGKVLVDTAELQQIPNVHFLGQKAYSELPAYSAHFAVGLIPFRINELTIAVSPIKLREYLSAGMPVVATALPEIVMVEDNPQLHTATTADEFIAHLATLLASPLTAEERREAALRMSADSWPGRCAQIARLVDEHVHR